MALLFLIGAPVQSHPLHVESHVRRQMVDAAANLIRSFPQEPGAVEQLFGFSQRELALHSLDDPGRRDWSYWPRPRAGLALGQMSAQQRALAHDLLAAILSSKGHLKVAQIMQLEDVQRALDTSNFPRRSDEYLILFFGTPSLSRPWAMRFEGHHVSINITLAADGAMSVTPLFLGASPAQIPSGPMAGLRALRDEETLAVRLLNSLDEQQRSIAIGSGAAPSEILSSQYEKSPSQWDDWKRERQQIGLPATQMNAPQREMLRQLVTEAVTTYRPEIADAVLRDLKVEQLSFLWLGSTKPGDPHYYRLRGGDFWFEYDDSTGGSGHVHTVWRNRRGDFGEDLLGAHYRADH